MTEDVKRHAVRIIADVCPGGPCYKIHEAQADALHSAGLLRTGLEEQERDRLKGLWRGAMTAGMRRAEELESALRAVEWGGWDDHDPDGKVCPDCGEPKRIGHSEGCVIRAALSSTPPTARPEESDDQ